MMFFIITCLLFGKSSGMIYKLNGSEYSKMPPVFYLDNYDHCLVNPNGVYCTADIDLVSDTPSELLTMIQNYSDYRKKHFNYSQLHHGICVTHTCRQFYEEDRTRDLKLILEECLNKTLFDRYELKCRINRPINCYGNETKDKDIGDLVTAALLIILLIINCISSLYDFYYVKRKKVEGNKYILCFSMIRNFSKLTSSYKNLDQRERRLKSLHGLRTMTMMCVIFCHSLISTSLAPLNTHFVEVMYDNILCFIFINGMIVVQIFLVISGCLMAYKLELYAEKHEIKWTLIPTGITSIWIRLTPSYAIALAITCTWLRHAGVGPFWKEVVEKEVDDCRMNGWKNLLYINNYFDDTQCMIQSWYLGTIMQISIIGYIACILTKTVKRRKAILVVLYIIGILAPAAHTYFQDLDAVLMFSPESARLVEQSETFNQVYKRGHTNLVNFVLGLALGSFIYRLQVNNVNMIRFKNFRFLLLLIFPGVLMTMFIGSVFYTDGPQASTIAKTVYVATIKPLFGLMILILILGCVFKIDNIYRVILEWNGWKIPSKLSYCAFLLHFIIIRAATGTQRILLPFNKFQMIELTITFVTLSYLVAIPFWILIDAPLTEFLRVCLHFSKSEKEAEVMKHGDENGMNLEKRNGASVYDNGVATA